MAGLDPSLLLQWDGSYAVIRHVGPQHFCLFCGMHAHPLSVCLSVCLSFLLQMTLHRFGLALPPPHCQASCLLPAMPTMQYDIMTDFRGLAISANAASSSSAPKANGEGPAASEAAAVAAAADKQGDAGAPEPSGSSAEEVVGTGEACCVLAEHQAVSGNVPPHNRLPFSFPASFKCGPYTPLAADEAPMQHAPRSNLRCPQCLSGCCRA